jgi:hypothetical protein
MENDPVRLNSIAQAEQNSKRRLKSADIATHGS